MVTRRAFIGTLAGGLLAAPLTAGAQPAGKVYRIGYLFTGSLESPETQALLDVFRQGLRERGHVEGRNILIEYRSADGNVERLPDLATELVRLKVDLIVALATPAARAAQKATKTIPIVASSMGDPVGDGLVASLARPGGNLTGTTFLGPKLVPKHLELLRESPASDLPRRGPVASRRICREHNERAVQRGRGRRQSATPPASSRGGAAPRGDRPRILEDDP